LKAFDLTKFGVGLQQSEHASKSVFFPQTAASPALLLGAEGEDDDEADASGAGVALVAGFCVTTFELSEPVPSLAEHAMKATVAAMKATVPRYVRFIFFALRAQPLASHVAAGVRARAGA
jgi:hypothetical protein